MFLYTFFYSLSLSSPSNYLMVVDLMSTKTHHEFASDALTYFFNRYYQTRYLMFVNFLPNDTF